MSFLRAIISDAGPRRIMRKQVVSSTVQRPQPPPEQRAAQPPSASAENVITQQQNFSKQSGQQRQVAEPVDSTESPPLARQKRKSLEKRIPVKSRDDLQPTQKRAGRHHFREASADRQIIENFTDTPISPAAVADRKRKEEEGEENRTIEPVEAAVPSMEQNLNFSQFDASPVAGNILINGALSHHQPALSRVGEEKSDSLVQIESQAEGVEIPEFSAEKSAVISKAARYNAPASLGNDTKFEVGWEDERVMQDHLVEMERKEILKAPVEKNNPSRIAGVQNTLDTHPQPDEKLDLHNRETDQAAQQEMVTAESEEAHREETAVVINSIRGPHLYPEDSGMGGVTVVDSTTKQQEPSVQIDQIDVIIQAPPPPVTTPSPVGDSEFASRHFSGDYDAPSKCHIRCGREAPQPALGRHKRPRSN